VPGISLVISDLDGTLWRTDDAVHDDVVEALSTLGELGVPLLVATGRRLTSTRQPLARIDATPPAVVLNGALGVDLATGERFHRAPFPTDQAVAVLAGYRSAGMSPVVYVDHPELDVFLGEAPSTHPEHVAALRPLAGVGDLERVVTEEVVLGFGVIGVPFPDGRAAAAAIEGVADVHLDRSIDHPGLAALMVAPRGQSKWDGVTAFCAARGIDPSRTLALGDGPNDLELLDRAAVRLVPEDAHPSALARADHVIPPAAAGGWAEVLRHLG
jgi:hydroxymethylpyrimidine pyrophosphatase-like HAD family hydrolase